MVNAEVLPLWCIVMAQLVAIISGQTCRTSNPRNRVWIPAAWKTIVDSSDYENLLPSFWVTRDVDNDGETFEPAGGICTRNLYSCPDTTFTLSGNENNWVFTHHISYGDAREVFYNISTSFTSCQFITNCQSYFTLYRYDTNSASETARTTTSNYQLLTGTQSSSRFGLPSPQTEAIVRPSGISGFYLGFRDTGTCGNVERVIAYYLVCPARVSGLVSFPETAVPPRSSPNETFSGSCAPNSHAVTSLLVDIISSTSVCTERAPGGARCECDAGYSSNTTSCLACQPGEYRALSQNQDRCNTCPSNTDTSMVSASVCACQTGYFRSPQEGPEDGCTQPPTAVQNLRTTSTTANSVTVSWERPVSTRRSDYYYFVGRSDPQGSATSVISVNDRLVDQGSTVTTVISGLLPAQSYVITVIAHNGVSSLDSVNVGSRTQTVEAQTMASPPGPPVVTPLCTVVVWQPPVNPNGAITGYQVRYAGEAPTDLSSATSYSVTSESQKTGNVQVQVRAKNAAGPGDWSDSVSVCPDSCSLPFSVTAMSTSLVLTWQRPSSASGYTYTIQARLSSAQTNPMSYTHTDDGNSLTYTIPSLTPFSSYVITLMNGQDQCTTTAATSEGAPSTPRNFKQYCEVVTWNTPSDLQGELKGYEVNIKVGDQQETNYLGPETLSYITTNDQRVMGTEIRVRANNTRNTGAWTSFYSIGCDGAGAKESSGVLSSTGAVDVVIIVVVTAAVCIAIFILIIILVYFFYKYRSNGSYSSKNQVNNNNSSSSDVKLNNIY